MSDSNAFTITIAGSAPTWYTSQAVSTWQALTAGSTPQLSNVDPCPGRGCSYSGVEGQAAVMDDYAGAVATVSSMIIPACGGHGGYGGNEVYEYLFNQETPGWLRRTNPSTSIQIEVPYYSDGKPTSMHQYNHSAYVPPLSGSTRGNRVYIPLLAQVWGSGNYSFGTGATYNLTTASWEEQGYLAAWNGDREYKAACAYDPVTEKIWMREGAGVAQHRISSYDVRTNVWTYYTTNTDPWVQSSNTAFIDPVRRVMVQVRSGSLYVSDLAFPTNVGRIYTVSGLTTTSAPGAEYEPVSGKWVFWNGGRTLQVITPPANYRTGDGSTANPLNASATYTVGQTINPGTGATPTSANPNGTYGRFQYIEQPKCFAVVNRTNQPMYVFKIPPGGL